MTRAKKTLVSKKTAALLRISRSIGHALAPAAPTLILLAARALAQSNNPFSAAETQLNTGLVAGVQLVATIGFLGAIGMIVMGYFRRWHWPWVFSLSGGLVLLALLSVAIDWLSNSSVTVQGTTGYGNQ